MNLVLNKNGREAVIRTDDGERFVPNITQLNEILKLENLKEQLEDYHVRDVKRLEELNSRKLKLNRATCGVMIGAISTSGILTIMAAQNAIDSDLARSVQMGAIGLGATITLMNETVLSRRRELLGLRECIIYEANKIDDIVSRISGLTASSDVIDEQGSILIDTRKELCQLDDVLNFIFYYASNKKKVLRMYDNGGIITFLERCGINSFDTIVEIEDYLFREFNNNKMYDDVMIKK